MLCDATRATSVLTKTKGDDDMPATSIAIEYLARLEHNHHEWNERAQDYQGYVETRERIWAEIRQRGRALECEVEDAVIAANGNTRQGRALHSMRRRRPKLVWYRNWLWALHVEAAQCEMVELRVSVAVSVGIPNRLNRRRRLVGALYRLTAELRHRSARDKLDWRIYVDATSGRIRLEGSAISPPTPASVIEILSRVQLD